MFANTWEYVHGELTISPRRRPFHDPGTLMATRSQRVDLVQTEGRDRLAQAKVRLTRLEKGES